MILNSYCPYITYPVEHSGTTPPWPWPNGTCWYSCGVGGAGTGGQAEPICSRARDVFSAARAAVTLVVLEARSCCPTLFGITMYNCMCQLWVKLVDPNMEQNLVWNAWQEFAGHTRISCLSVLSGQLSFLKQSQQSRC